MLTHISSGFVAVRVCLYESLACILNAVRPFGVAFRTARLQLGDVVRGDAPPQKGPAAAAP